MKSVLKEIQKIRGGKSANIIELPLNRYSILCQESDRTRSAYYFSVPIRNIQTNSVVDLRFEHNKFASTFIGSEAKITVNEQIHMSNLYGKCSVIIQGRISEKTEDGFYMCDGAHNIEIHPTLNGLMLTMTPDTLLCYPKLILRLDRTYQRIRENQKCVSIMREEFVPFITISCIGVINTHGEVVAPCEISCQQIGNVEYALSFSKITKSKSRIAIEINMQETKLFQDTTVESNHPGANNAFGGVAFLGTSDSFGEQWLYSRLEISNILQYQNKKILKAYWHIPKLGECTATITANEALTRFCSFGSNWENKKPIANLISESYFSDGYYHFDVTSVLKKITNNSTNIVLRANSSKKPVIIPTGDSFFTPQILEVKYQ